MLSLIQDLVVAASRGQPVCYAACVESRASTSQKAGAAMLVFSDGSQSWSLGNGAIDAKITERALRLLIDGSTELMKFQLDNTDAGDDLNRSGGVTILLDPVRPGDDIGYYVTLLDNHAMGRGVTEGIVINAKQSNGGFDGDRWLLNGQGEVIARKLIAKIGRSDDIPPTNLVRNLRSLAERPRPYISAGISYCPFPKRCRLIIIGAGDVGQKVAQLAAEVDFDVWVVDDRHEYCNPVRFPTAKRLIVDAFETAIRGLNVDSESYCIIVTQLHNQDGRALLELAETNVRYLGMIGNHRKITRIFDDLIRAGISREALARVHAPIGLDIGSQTVPEIAISIAAELVADRNLGRTPPELRPANILETPEGT